MYGNEWTDRWIGQAADIQTGLPPTLEISIPKKAARRVAVFIFGRLGSVIRAQLYGVER